MIKDQFQIIPVEHGFLTLCEKEWGRVIFAINEFIPS